jgi:hypothetical protein
MKESAELAESARQGAERVFDFTQPVDTFDAETKTAYHMLRRVAILAGDAKQYPDGKTYTQSQVIEILGEDYAAGLGIAKPCCG